MCTWYKKFPSFRESYAITDSPNSLADGCFPAYAVSWRHKLFNWHYSRPGIVLRIFASNFFQISQTTLKFSTMGITLTSLVESHAEVTQDLTGERKEGLDFQKEQYTVAIKRQAKKIYTGRRQGSIMEIREDSRQVTARCTIHPYVPVSANLYQYAWNSPLKYADPMGRDVEESEWERYLELGLTGYVKYGYHMITDYMPDELMLVSGAMNPLVMTGTMAEAQVNGRWDELDYLLIKNNRSYSHGFTEGFWDFTLGNLEGLVTKPVDDVYRMSSYVGDVFSGRNTDNWLMTGAKLISMPMQFVSGIPIYDSLDRMDEDIEKAKSVFRVGRQIMQMSPAEKAELALSAGVALPWTGRAVYNHYNAVFHSEERVAQLFYNGGYGVGAVRGIAADVIVGNAVAKEMMQIGGEIGGKLRGIQNVDDVIENGSKTIPPEAETRLDELVDEIRQDIGKDYPTGNVGAAVTDIDGVTSEIKSYSKYNNSISSSNINHEYSYNFGEGNRIFSTKSVNSANLVDGPGAYNRAIDSEAKILEDIAHQLGYNKFCVDETVTGNVYLITERVPCSSCQDVIEQFRQMFPNVNVIVKSKY